MSLRITSHNKMSIRRVYYIIIMLMLTKTIREELATYRFFFRIFLNGRRCKRKDAKLIWYFADAHLYTYTGLCIEHFFYCFSFIYYSMFYSGSIEVHDVYDSCTIHKKHGGQELGRENTNHSISEPLSPI